MCVRPAQHNSLFSGLTNNVSGHPRCATTLEAVHFEDYVIAYCPSCQTGGRTLKDRRLSRLLK